MPEEVSSELVLKAPALPGLVVCKHRDDTDPRLLLCVVAPDRGMPADCPEPPTCVGAAHRVKGLDDLRQERARRELQIPKDQELAIVLGGRAHAGECTSASAPVLFLFYI